MLERITDREQIDEIYSEFAQESNWFWWVEGAYPDYRRFESWVLSAESDPLGFFVNKFKDPDGSYKLLGFTKFYNTSIIHGFTYFTVWILPSLRRSRGLTPYGMIAASQSIEFAFQTMPIRKMYQHIVEDNSDSLRPMKKVSQVEGVLENHLFFHNEYKNLMILSITRDSWSIFYSRYKHKIEKYF